MRRYSFALKLGYASVFLSVLLCITVLGQDVPLVGQEPPRDFTLVRPQPGFNLATPRADPTQIGFGPSPADAVSYAVADLAALPKEDQPFQRYVWVPDGSAEKGAQVSFVVNTAISKASVIIKPKIVAEGRLIRWDLRVLAPREGQYATLHALWEKLAFEPYFHIIQTTDDAVPTNAVAVERLADDPPGSQRFKIGNDVWFRSGSGKWFFLQNQGWVERRPTGLQRQNVATFGAHCGLQQAVLLQGLSQSNAAISTSSPIASGHKLYSLPRPA